MPLLSDENLKTFTIEQLIVYIKGLHKLINDMGNNSTDLLCTECHSFSNDLEKCYLCGSCICGSCKSQMEKAGEPYKCCPLCN
jgi:hypothetical protein